MDVLTAAGCNARIGVLAYCKPSTIVYAAYNNIIIFNIRDQHKIVRPVPSPACTVSTNSESIFVGCQNGEIVLFSLDRFEEIYSEKMPSAVSYSCSFKNSFVYGCIDGSIHLHRKHESSALVSIAYPKTVTSLGVCDASFPLLLVAISDLTVGVYLIEDAKASHLLTLSDHHVNWVNMITCRRNRFLTCGQDKNARLWVIKEKQVGLDNTLVEELVSANRTFTVDNTEYSIETEAILMGHEDSVLSGYFVNDKSVLTSSADRTIIKWMEGADAWQSELQVGDVTGIGTSGNGDLFDAHMMDCDNMIIAHNTNGSVVGWLSPDYQPIVVASGHLGEVTDISFDPSGHYILTCSLDRTTRAWILANGKVSEIARPQIHGYELRSLGFLSDSKFVSAGEEKVLRIFQATSTFSARISSMTEYKVEDVATGGVVFQPALGLSNKLGDQPTDASPRLFPLENELSSSTLFPEIDKLYGHGDDVQCVTVSPDRKWIASAPRAALSGDTSIRIWCSGTHHTIHTVRPHTLTIASLSFSPDSRYLLSVSRDRRFAITDVSAGSIVYAHEDAHDRIIWDGIWVDNDCVATGSRDKSVKIWSISNKQLFAKVSFDQAVTALAAFFDSILVGLETGELYKLRRSDLQLQLLYKVNGRINKISTFRNIIALGSSDHTTTILNVENQ